MIYLSTTYIDADTGVVCTAEPMRTGPAYPEVKGFVYEWHIKSNWPIATTPEGAHTVAPLFFGTCDDDADLSIPGVVATYTAEEYRALKTAEHQACRPFPSWIGDEETMTWNPPIPYPDNIQSYWDEATLTWVSPTDIVNLP